jgi:hypothetical protein
LGQCSVCSKHIAICEQPLIAKFYTVARKIPFEDPVILNYVRIGYIVSQVIILGAYYYVSLAVCFFLETYPNAAHRGPTDQEEE